MHYLLIYELAPDYLERRGALRADHLRLAWRSHDRALLLFEADSPDVARRFAEQDPYVTQGLVTRWEVRQWITVAGDRSATPVRPEDVR